MRGLHFFLISLFFASLCETGVAAPRAVIVVGLSTSESQSARLGETASSLREGFIARGITADAITLLAPAPGAPLRRESVLAALAPSSADETWLVLLGTSAPGRDGQPAFQLSGPRLTAADLAKAVAALPGKKYLVIATSASGGFLPPLLALPDVEATAATADSGQISEPRFAAFWAEALAAQPRASFSRLAAAAAERVAAYYGEHSLAQSESARLIDRATGSIIEAPFNIASESTAASATSAVVSKPTQAAPVDIAALSFPAPRTGDEIEHRPADDESRALLAASRAAAADSPHAAVVLRTEAGILVARDFSARETWRTRAYLRTGEALDELGTLRLPSDPPFVSSRLVSARVIRPDGSQLLLNPAARSARLAAEAGAAHHREISAPAPAFIELPEVSAGCIVEAEWTVERRADGELPAFYREWPLAGRFPQHSLHLTVTLPRANGWRVFAPNLSSEPATTGDTGAVTRTWTLADLPAFDPLPGDPPARTVAPWVGISSLASWEDFAAWYRRLAAGSDTAGPGVEAFAAEIAAALPDRAGRLRAAYERIAALRYVAVELGVGAFRPRTPEQVWRQRYGDCKDKANLLVALLSRLGIPAEFALVNRFDATFTEFPGWQFNHALVRVPAAPAGGQPLDLWLDTTDRLVPFGVVAPGDLNRKALVFSRDFSTAAFHEITAAQEPPAVWQENYAALAGGGGRITLSATGAAEVRLRHLVLNLGPAQRAARLGELLGIPVASVDHSDPYDLARPYSVVVHVNTLPDAKSPMLPGLRAYLETSSRPRLWDEGRSWTCTRTSPSGTVTENIPAHLP